MSTEKTDFLRFNAYSIKDLITRKLSEDSNFTDQVYEGSNLAVLIDIVSYMFQCFMYNLNNAASESMFSDTQIYENMNRLCKLIGYSPRGFIPTTMTIYVENTGENSDDLVGARIPRYSYFDTGLTDSNGNKICFSTVKNGSSNIETINNETYHKLTVYNGKWKMYGTVFTASGTDYETFVLADVKSDSENDRYVANNFIDVYVESNGSITPWYYDRFDIFHVSESTNFQDNASQNPQFHKLYDEDDEVYSVRLNEDRQYEIKFGNGTSGKRLNKGDKVYVFYLDTNGMDGKIDTSQLGDDIKFECGASQFGITNNLYKRIVLGDEKVDEDDLITNHDEDYTIIFNNTVTTPIAEQDVEDIRENAPECFKTGNRLITKNDYEYFMKNLVSGGIVDVKCMNNWEYMSTFFAWLYKIGKENHGDGSYYLNETRFSSYFGSSTNALTDAADQNNVYLWIKTETEVDDLGNVVNSAAGLENIKTLTTQTQYLKPIDVYFDICAAPLEVAQQYFVDQDQNFGMNDSGEYDSYIEITLDDNKIYINNSIESIVITKIKQFFDINKNKLGQNVNFNDLANEIYKINGVSNVRTVYDPDVSTKVVGGMTYGSRAYDGLSFASWSKGLIDLGDDLNISNTRRTLEKFQFPTLLNYESLGQKIKIIKKQLNNTQYIKS